ncbi:MAG: hypothetical protein ACREK1_10565, partial [Longimicrobiales bacterium]
MKNAFRFGVLAAVFVACAEEPLGFVASGGLTLSLLQGGTGGVYFLPPLFQSEYEGTFAPDREPVVVICADAPATPCASAVAEFDMVQDPGEAGSRVVRVNVEDEQYLVNWKTSDAAEGVYRIFVVEKGVVQAFIDVALTGGGSVSRARVTTYGSDKPLAVSGTVPIAFRMEHRDIPDPSNGLRAEYFDWRNTPLDFTAAPLILERVDTVMDFADADGT